ncbi:MAG: SDR family NAD(P)-dependent oxidoreductase [Candidatus Marinimicrobia bacterium]|nr:SDR family NAD(P)-dependent oxidoreductase [Candidatus Neomarinimicrobiota bacterium]MDP7072083.1 SDR family NAD(P)-dependent oxidoreductase [Candidatus Neomarinimicrobiota bacterium]
MNSSKKVFITGASSGIGEYLSYAYAERGYFIGLAARRRDRLDLVQSKCESIGSEAKVYELDVLDEKACREAAQDFISLPGEIDSIYANAGVGGADNLSSGTAEAMNRVLSINILGATNTVMPFIPYLKEQKSGKIAVVSSVASFRGLAHHSAYSGSKAAVRNICQGWGTALHKHGISVTAVCPGFIKSEMTDRNDIPMPFLMDTDVAAEKIIKAVNKGKKVFIFPWQWKVLVVPLMRFAPDWLVQKIGM